MYKRQQAVKERDVKGRGKTMNKSGLYVSASM